jgi:hypothetical protein
MPRPTPLLDPSNPYPRFDTQLTPRTPHSRAGRAEESYSAFELEQTNLDDDQYTVEQQQNAPLLSSSASESFPPGYRSRGDDYVESSARKEKRRLITADTIISRLPLALYSCVAAILLVLVFFSLREPAVLKKYVGIAVEPSVHAKIILSYENYTSFPLEPLQFRAECIKLNPLLLPSHSYWNAEVTPVDVVHPDEQPEYTLPLGEAPICNRTMTYQLDGWAGLLTDMALLAQVAALAREVRSLSLFIFPYNQ